MKKISISIIIIAFLLALSYAGFGKSTEITDYELVSGIAIDKSENLWKITCEITNVSKDKAFGNRAKYVKGEGFTVEKAFENAADKSDKLFYLDSVRIFVISEALKTDKELQNYFLKSDVNMRAVAVLCEIGYHDNTEDAAWIRGNITPIAANLTESLCDYFGIPFVMPQAVRRGMVVTDGSTLHLRSLPNTSSRIIAAIPNGATVTIYGTTGNWYVVSWNGQTGYVYSDFVTVG